VNLAQHLEHTILKADATTGAVTSLCADVVAHGMRGACVNPHYVPLARSLLGGKAELVTVVGFPLGAGSARSDLVEAEWVIGAGASEVDWVVPVGLACSGELARVTVRAKEMRKACSGVVLKVILETGLFSPAQLEALALAVLEAGPDFLKTSTGFGPRGASVEDVVLLARIAQGAARIKASGGIRNFAQARALLQAGAERIGTSNGVGLLDEARNQQPTV
jgi:deoxyribose-phosphate aldolase